MTRLYIAGPMTGYDDLNYPAFNEAEERLKAAGYEVENPVHNDKPGEGDYRTWEWFMRQSLLQVARCDGIATLPNWHASRGARLEVHVGAHLMPVQTVHEWVWEAGVR